VGAVLLAESGKTYTGCNIENAAYSPTNCAERTAFFKAVSEGERHFKAIVVAGWADGKPGFAWPCGVCRQVMAEFCAPEKFLIFVTDGNTVHERALKDLLPESFGPDNLNNGG
jgi:cytidine deaminase